MRISRGSHFAILSVVGTCMGIACSKKSGSSSPAATAPAPSPGADTGGGTGGGTTGGGTTGGTTGSLALNAGTVAFNVQPVSSSKGFALVNESIASASSKTKPGTLAINPSLALTSGSAGQNGLSLTGTGTSTASNSAGAPVSFSYSIASGAPDSFQISLTKIELSVAQPSTNPQPPLQVTPAGQVASGTGTAPKSSTTCASGVAPTATDTGSATATGTGTTTATASSGTATAIAASTQMGNPTLVLFNNPAGTNLSVVSGTLDLGALAGSCGSFPVVPSANAYNQVTVTFLREAKVSGCVTSKFINPGNKTPNNSGTHTYCTQTGFSTFDGAAPTNATFESTVGNPLTGELMGLDLAFGSNPNSSTPASATDTVSVTFPINPTLMISKAGQQVPLTIVIDLNRMMRYYNGNTGNFTGAPAGQTFFFTSIFAQSIYAFVGTPGHIYGYDMVYENCDVDNKGPYVANADPTLATCAGGIGSPQVINNANIGTGQDPWGSVGGWLTVVTDSAGAPLVVNLMSNDDNDLVILKGTVNGITTPFTAGTGAGQTNISYGQGNSTPNGVLENFPTDLGLAMSAAANPGATGPVVGTQITGVTFTAHTPAQGNGSVGSTNKGPVYLQVGLSD